MKMNKFAVVFLISFAISSISAQNPIQRGSKLDLGDDLKQNDIDRPSVNDPNNHPPPPPMDSNNNLPPAVNPAQNSIGQQQDSSNRNQQAAQPNYPRLGGVAAAAAGLRQLERRPPPQSAAGDHLADRSECAQDISKYCSKIPRQSDVAILQCLQDIGERDDSLGDDCQHLLWEFKMNLTQDERFKKAAMEFCKEYLENSECGRVTSERGHMISCLSDLKDQMTDGHCKSFLTRMQSVVFTDFRLVGPFMMACREDIRKFSCGQLEDDRFGKATEPPPLVPGQPSNQQQNQQAKIPHSQGATLDCLIRKLIETGKGDRELNATCRHEIIRIAELQADDFHLDRPLFFACRNDRERFCSGVTAGEGRVFQCLSEHRYQNDMSRECQATLDVRLQLLGQDYRISKQLLNGCKQEMQRYNCDFRPSDPKLPPPPEHMYLSYVILCLEEAGRKESNHFTPQCQTQLFEHRRMLMSDYRMDPEIVLTCSDDIAKLCGDRLEDGGKTLHCLMGHVRNPRTHDKMNAQCKQAITHIIQAANVGGDYRVDRVLYSDCRPLIDSVCLKQMTSQQDVLSCLMTNVESPLMSEDCENRLLEVQYFLARDYKLDPQLFHACKEDAASRCGDNGPWVEKAVMPAPPLDGGNQAQQQAQQNQVQPLAPGAERGYLVMTCLYRHLFDDDEANRPSPKCSKEVQRVMRERSISVNLMPHIEDACLTDLGEKCSQRTGHGEEMRCLQENLKELSKDCQKVVQEFTEQESVDNRLDHALMRACGPVLEQYCKNSLDKVIDKGDILDCLLKNKGVPVMNSKCRTFVNHYELVSLKDYKFTYKFRQSCKSDIEKNCLKEGQATDKASIVGCLSEVVVKHALLNDQVTITKECRKQLRAEYFSLETVEKKLGDPKLISNCESDLKQHCDQADTAAAAFECLRERKQELEPRCRKYVFKKEKLEFQDNTFDVTLNRVCADEIRMHCANEQPERVLYCLKTKLEREGVQKSFECNDLVRRRKVDQAGDIRLQPMLQRACAEEINLLCKDKMSALQMDAEAESVVIGCLRDRVTSQQKGLVISPGCTLEVRRIIYESEIDPSLDPPFYRNCKEEILSKCTPQLMARDGHQSLLECMKLAYNKGVIGKSACKKELARKINEELADIHLDPELNTACAADIQHYCDDVKAGDGKLLKCLLDATKSTNVRLTQQCHQKLLDREALWKHVKSDNLAINIPGELGEAMKAIYVSPVRNTLATILLIVVLFIFCFGLCCGRFTRRIKREMKNR